MATRTDFKIIGETESGFSRELARGVVDGDGIRVWTVDEDDDVPPGRGIDVDRRTGTVRIALSRLPAETRTIRVEVSPPR